MILLATMMLPSQVTLVPNYIIFKQLHLLDTLAALYIGGFFGGGAFYIFLLRQFILGLPIELDESAKIDGAPTFTIFWRIIFPLTKPALLTVFIFSFQDNYTDFFTPLVFINTITKYTVPVGINMFLDDAGSGNLGAVIAMTSLSVVPLIVLYFIAQKQFMQGISTTGLKG
jgi:multiple sugar transport system permease protein